MNWTLGNGEIRASWQGSCIFRNFDKISSTIPIQEERWTRSQWWLSWRRWRTQQSWLMKKLLLWLPQKSKTTSQSPECKLNIMHRWRKLFAFVRYYKIGAAREMGGSKKVLGKFGINWQQILFFISHLRLIQTLWSGTSWRQCRRQLLVENLSQKLIMMTSVEFLITHYITIGQLKNGNLLHAESEANFCRCRQMHRRIWKDGHSRDGRCWDFHDQNCSAWRSLKSSTNI